MPTHKEHQIKLKEREAKVVNVSKRTTKVTLIVAAAVVIFFIAGAAYILWIRAHPRQTTNSVHQEVKQP